MRGCGSIVRQFQFGSVLAAVLALPQLASAAWLGYKNETQAVIAVQTSIVVNNKIVRGKPHALYPGEVAWDNIATPGIREIAIYDPKANNRLVHKDTITVQNQDIFLGVRVETPPAQPGKPPPQPQVKLVPTRPPGPPGVVPPANPPKAMPPAAPGKPNTPPPGKPNTPPPATPSKPNTPPPATPNKPNTPPPAKKSGGSGT